MVQVICSVAIRVIQTMPEDFNKEQQKELDINNKDKKEKVSEDKEEPAVQGIPHVYVNFFERWKVMNDDLFKYLIYTCTSNSQ